MRRRDAFKRICAGLVLVLGVSLLSACESRTVDYGDGGTTENIQTVKKDANKGVEQFMGASKWKDEWETTDADGHKVTISVSADIALPNEEQMYVIEVEETVFDAAYKEKMAKVLFGDGPIYYNDPTHYTKDQLQKRYNETLDAYNFYISEEWGEEYTNGLEAKLEQYEELLQTATDARTPVETYDVNEYCGERDGILYWLSFWDKEWCDENWEGNDTRTQLIEFSSMSAVYPNAPDSEEAARMQVEDWMGRLGLECFVCTESMQLANAYQFWFEKGINETPFGTYGVNDESGNILYNKKKGAEKRYDLRSVCEISVSDNGIEYLRIENPLEVTGISDAVEMLPLATVQDIIKDKVTNEFGRFRFKYGYDLGWEIKFDYMELIYFRVRDKENDGHYSYVPAWRLSNTQKEYKSPILINAIDGSVIDFYDEI